MSETDKIFIEGVTERYPMEILNGRVKAEAAVVGLIWKDPLLLDETKLSSSDFLTHDGVFYFSIAKELRNKRIMDFNEVAISTHLDQEIAKRFYERGGYTAILKLQNITSSKNRESILDELSKYNVYTRLYDNGFDLLKRITVRGKKVVPLDYFEQKNMTSTEILEFYTVSIAQMDQGYNAQLLEDADLEITDDFIVGLNNSEEYGTPYAIAGTDINGNDMSVFPWLSKQTLGFKKKATHFIAGFSSSGKTCMWCSIVMAMAREEKVLIICNEQSSKVWKINMLLFILYKRFRYTGLSKQQLMIGNFSDEQLEYVKKAQAYFNETYKGRIHFIQLSENNMDLVKSKIRYYALQLGFSMVVYDTLKIADLNFRDNGTQAYELLVQYSRDLDILAKRYDLIMCASVQLAQSQKGHLFLDSNMLSGAKGMVEQLDTLLCIRDVYKEELDPTNTKFYCHPFRKKLQDGEWKKEPFQCNPDDAWKMVFLSKSRNSEASGSTGECLMFRFQGQFAVFQEQCWGVPKHGTID